MGSPLEALAVKLRIDSKIRGEMQRMAIRIATGIFAMDGAIGDFEELPKPFLADESQLKRTYSRDL